MNRDRAGGILGAGMGGIVLGFAFVWIIGLLPWCKYDLDFLCICAFVCGVVCIVYLGILRAPDEIYLDEEERPGLLSSLLGEFVSALPVSLITAPVLVVLLSFLFTKTS